MTNRENLILALIVGGLIGAILTVAIRRTKHGVYEIGFKDKGTVNRFTIYKDRLHLMVALPVTSESSGIIDTRKEVEDAKDKPRTLQGAIDSKDHQRLRRQR